MHADIGASRVNETPLSLELLSLNKALCTFLGYKRTALVTTSAVRPRLNCHLRWSYTQKVNLSHLSRPLISLTNYRI